MTQPSAPRATALHNAVKRMSSTIDVSTIVNRTPLDEATAHHAGKSIFDPQSRFLKFWHQLLLLAILYEMFIIPFTITFTDDSATDIGREWIAFYAVEVLFLTDFWVKLNTGSYDESGVDSKQRSRLKYLKSIHFVVDVVAIIPLSLMVPKSVKVNEMYFELAKVLRLERIPTYLMTLDDIYAKHFEALKIFKTIVSTLTLSHYLACIRYWFGYDEHRHNHWLPKKLEHPSTQTEYLRALFWAFGMLTGLFEGELPHKITEFAFTIIVALCGFSVFTFLCGMFFMLSKCESGNSEEAEARINQLKHIMAFHRVPDRLQTQAIEYLKRYSTDAESNDREALRLLCPSIAKDVQVELLKDTMNKIPVFAGCSEAFVRALTSSLEVMYLPAHCTVFSAGDEGDAMYIIHSGVLDVILGTAKVRELRKGDFVGELSLFSNRSRSATVVTATYSVLYQLLRFHTEKVLEGYPEFVPTVRQTVMDLIAKTDRKPTTPTKTGEKTGAEASEPRKERRGSVFTSQLMRMMSNPAKPAKRSSIVAPDVSPGTVKERRESARAQPDNLMGIENAVRVVGRLRRVLTRKQHKVGNVGQLFDDQYTRTLPAAASEARTGWHRLLLAHCVDADSRLRLWWLVALQFVLFYDWIMTPLQLAFVVVDFRVPTIIALHFIVDMLSFADIYLNFNLSFTHNSEKIMDPTRSASRYLRKGFMIDLLLAFPFWWFDSRLAAHAFLRLPRLLRVRRLSGHVREFETLFHIDSRRKLLMLWGLLLMLCHVVACLYFSVTFLEGYSHHVDAWIPTNDIELHKIGDGSMLLTSDNEMIAWDSPEARHIAMMQYSRSFYYATNVLTGLGKTVEPVSDTQYAVALVFMLCGFIITAVVVDNVQKRFTASAFEQKEFFAGRTRIQLFLRRQNAPLAIHHRVNSYLDYWWSAHRGAHLGELVADLPLAYRREILRSICQPALQTLALLNGVRQVLVELEAAFVDTARFVLYGQGEFVYHEGDNAHFFYFLLHGSVVLERSGTQTGKVTEGGFFGTRALEREQASSASFAEDAIASSGCILLRLSYEDSLKLAEVFPEFQASLILLEKRLHDSKLARFTSDVHSLRTESTSRTISRFLEPLDPDSLGALAWETWLFITMTVQWALTLYHMSFGVEVGHFAAVDSLKLVLEVSFLIDIYIRTRMGYHEFGNKIMDVRLIRRRYFYSKDFVIDMAALLPLFAINWMMTGARYELLNINKLLRLLKVPKQFKQLEQRYLKRTTELRIVKLMYYMFLLTHVAACVYHDFSSHLSLANLKDPHLESRKTEYGWNLWLLFSWLEDADTGLQYFSSLFWSFGLMSASYQCELPKTIPQSVFSVMTMMCGFFLFAYVIGNFADVIEMVDAENREFNARLGLVRHLLTHFTLPKSVAQRLTGLYFFRRYHSITQEHFIERCLPPSLVTDIRLVNLQPMISKVPFMGGMEPAITRMLVAQFSQVLVLRDDFVYRLGDEGTDMFFVFTGYLAVMSYRLSKKSDYHVLRSRTTASRTDSTKAVAPEGEVDIKSLRQVSELVSGDFFGENALFNDSPRNAFVLAQSSCILYSLSRDSLNLVFELYPNWKRQVMQSVKIQQKQHRIHGVTSEKIREGMSATSTREDDDMDAAVAPETSVAPVRPKPKDLRGKRGVRYHVTRVLQAFMKGTEAQSRVHLVWLRIIVMCTVFNAVVGAYRISIDGLNRWTGVCTFVRLVDIFCDIVFVVDIWFNWHLKESVLSVELYEQNLLASYKKERLLWDVISAAPLDYILSLVSSSGASWIRLLRCLKVANLMSYLNEINRHSLSYERARFIAIWLHYGILMFWAACAYLALGVYGGYGEEWNMWAPSQDIEYDQDGDPDADKVVLRFFRGAFYATTAFVKKARTFYPLTTGHLAFSISVSFIGVFGMAFMIGEIASLYVSSIGNQVNFRKNHISVELFLSRYKISEGLRERVHGFLLTLWSAHAGVNYQGVLSELPSHMRTDTIIHITDTPLHCFLESVFRPLIRSDANSMKALLRSVSQELQFEGYSRGEYVISEGVISTSMYFVVKGHLIQMSSTAKSEPPVRIKKGQYFGEKGIITLSVSRYSVQTLKVCDLFSLSSDAFIRILKAHPFLHIVLQVADQVVSEVRAASDDGVTMPTEIGLWRTVLGSVLQAQKTSWLSKDISAGDSKGMTLWTTLLLDLLDGDAKDNGLDAFEKLFTLLAPNGSIFKRPRATVLDPTGSRVKSNGSNTAKGRLRGLVMKISTAGAVSATSIRAKSTRESQDQVQPFVNED